MARIKTLLIPVVLTALILSGCASAETTPEGESSSSDKTAEVYAGSFNGADEYVDVSVKSFTIMDDKITGLNSIPFQYLPDVYKVADSGEILCDYKFAAVGLTLLGSNDIEINLSGFTLGGKSKDGSFSCQCYYNDSPSNPDTPKTSGYTELTAGTEKQVTIGFFLTDEQAACSDFTLEPVIVYTGEQQPQIKIENY